MTDTTPGTDGAAGVAATDDDLSVVRAVTDGVQTLIIADFADTASALDAYQGLKALQDGRTVEVEGAIVVSRDADGTLTVQEATDHSTGRGATWGAIGGAVLGVVFPPSIIGGAVVAGLAGAAIGKGRHVHHKHQLADELQYAIDPGHSGLVALVSDPGAVEIAKALDKAGRIVRKAVDDAAADDIRAAAKAAEDETKST